MKATKQKSVPEIFTFLIRSFLSECSDRAIPCKGIFFKIVINTLARNVTNQLASFQPHGSVKATRASKVHQSTWILSVWHHYNIQPAMLATKQCLYGLCV